MKMLQWYIQQLLNSDQIAKIKAKPSISKDFVGIVISYELECGFKNDEKFNSIDEAKAFLAGMYQIATWNKDEPF